MVFLDYMKASHSTQLPTITSDTRTCADCGKIILDMHSRVMGSVITHRGNYRAQGLCEVCSIRNDKEKYALKLRTLSKLWKHEARTNNVGGRSGNMNDPGPVLIRGLIDFIAGGTDEEEEDNRSKAAALNATAGLIGNLRLLTYIWDRHDPKIKVKAKRVV